MQRRLRLKVLYWPLFASLCIILLLMRWEPLMVWLRPALAPWLPVATVGAAADGFAADDSAAGPPAAGTVTVTGSVGVTPVAVRRAADSSLLARGEVDHPVLPAELPMRDDSGWRGAAGAGNSLTERADSWRPPSGWDQPLPVASGPAVTARLWAPRLPADVELAGLDLSYLDGPPARPEPTRPVAARRQVTAILASAVSPPSLRIGRSEEAVESEPRADHAASSLAASSLVPPAEAVLSLEPAQIAEAAQPLEDVAARLVDPSGVVSHRLGGGWPEVPQLQAELSAVARVARRPLDGSLRIRFASQRPIDTDFDLWQQQVNAQLQRLQRLPSISSPESAEILAALETLADEGHGAAEAVTDRPTQVVCLRASHALQRRVAVWNSVYHAMQSPTASIGDQPTSAGDQDSIASLLDRLLAQTAASDDPAGWQSYLLLPELSAANTAGEQDQRRLVAQRFLSRLDWRGLTDCQRQWLQHDSVQQLASAMRRWAVVPVDYAALLSQLERQESDAIDLGSIDVARAAQTLRFASSAEAVAVAGQLNALYRNANVRLAVTDDLIQRLMPPVDTRLEPVRQQILGADVRGQSIVDSRVSVRFIPSPHSWHLELLTDGNVLANTASRNGPVSIRNGSQADFHSVTPIEIGLAGADSGQTTVQVQSQTRMRGIDTDYDAIPLFSTLIREVARSRYQSLAPAAKQIQESRIRRQVEQEVDQQLSQQLDAAADRYAAHLAGPLSSLGLNPTVVDLQTSEQRLTARYRVGGDWQLAAFTPRPRAPGDSLLSLQLHQSALNNTLESVLPAGESVTIAQLIDQLRTSFALPDQVRWADEADQELANETHIHFAPTRPVTIEIEDDTLWVTLRVMRLHGARNLDLRRFVVRAAYRVQLDGMTAHLVRDGHLRISGPGMSMRDRLPVRAIFNKVFSNDRPLSLIPTGLQQHDGLQGLAITQFELRDGWLGLAIGPAVADRVATLPAAAQLAAADPQPTPVATPPPTAAGTEE